MDRLIYLNCLSNCVSVSDISSPDRMHFNGSLWIPSVEETMRNEDELSRRRSPLFSSCLPILTLKYKITKSRTSDTIAFRDDFSKTLANPFLSLYCVAAFREIYRVSEFLVKNRSPVSRIESCSYGPASACLCGIAGGGVFCYNFPLIEESLR